MVFPFPHACQDLPPQWILLDLSSLPMCSVNPCLIWGSLFWQFFKAGSQVVGFPLHCPCLYVDHLYVAGVKWGKFKSPSWLWAAAGVGRKVSSGNAEPSRNLGIPGSRDVLSLLTPEYEVCQTPGHTGHFGDGIRQDPAFPQARSLDIGSSLSAPGAALKL